MTGVNTGEVTTVRSRVLRTATLCIVLLLQSNVCADWLEVRRSATVKKEPLYGVEILARVDSGTRLPLTQFQQTNGYYQVSLSDGRTGWIYRSLVTRHLDDSPATTPVSAEDAPVGTLEIHVINVGQADAILIRCPDGNHELLIDAADTRYPHSGQMFKTRMAQLQQDDNRIEVVVATHPHADHIGNMAWVLNTYPVDLYVDNGVDYDSATYNRVDRAWEDNGCRYWSGQDELVPELDFCPRADVDARMLRPRGFGHDRNPNNNSIVLRVDYGATSMLFVGDAEHEEEQLLLEDPSTRALLDCDFLKVGHHGSDTSSGVDFLDAVTPEIAVISCGEKGVGTNHSYKHPRVSTLTALLSRTDARDGGVVSVDAFDGDERAWKRIELDKAVYETVGSIEVTIESDGQTVRCKP